jgi:hypothetical protein
LQQPDTADERQDENGQKHRRAFERFEFHRIGLNKKPGQLKVALVENVFIRRVKVADLAAQRLAGMLAHRKWGVTNAFMEGLRSVFNQAARLHPHGTAGGSDDLFTP